MPSEELFNLALYTKVKSNDCSVGKVIYLEKAFLLTKDLGSTSIFINGQKEKVKSHWYMAVFPKHIEDRGDEAHTLCQRFAASALNVTQSDITGLLHFSFSSSTSDIPFKDLQGDISKVLFF